MDTKEAVQNVVAEPGVVMYTCSSSILTKGWSRKIVSSKSDWVTNKTALRKSNMKQNTVAVATPAWLYR